jgi:hypothetical protein
VGVAGLALAGLKWVGKTVLGGFGLGGLFGGGGAAAGARIAAGAEAAASSTGFLAGLSPPVAAAAAATVAARLAHPGVYQALKEGNPAFGAAGGDLPYYPPSAQQHNWGPWHAGGSPSGPIVGGRDPRSPSVGPYAYHPPSHPADVNVSGAATVDQTLRIEVAPSAWFQTMVDRALQQSETTIPLIGGGSGQMDSDAGPHRPGGIGKM